MKRLTRLCENTENGKYIPYTTGVYTGIFPDCTLGEVVEKLAAYEETGLTPQEIEHMKARMPLNYWAGENKDKMSIFGVAVSRLMELAKADQEGRLAIFSVEDIHPCRYCNTGWGSISSEGCKSCEETCVRLKEYYEKYST